MLGGDEGIELMRERSATSSPRPPAWSTQDAGRAGAALRRGAHRRRRASRCGRGSTWRTAAAPSPIAERAQDELAATGARPRRVELTGVESLTPSERRITAMASEGLSNPQIAQALFLTRRTVEMHLTNAYRKLDISSRDELPEALGEAG